MLEKNKRNFKLGKKGIAAVVAGVIITLMAGFVYFIVQAKSPAEIEQQNSGSNAAFTPKKTGFDGINENDMDPEAKRIYCEDIIERAQRDGGGSTIRDMCILNNITSEYLPSMSDVQIATMAAENPSCLQTGYDGDGFNCFTGFNVDGCNREGLKEDGTECRVDLNPEIVKSPLENTFNGDICSAVSNCQSESAFSPEGFNKFGCDRQGRKENGELCAAEYITKIYGEDGRDQLGFTEDGFNIHNCDMRGLNPEGLMCSLDKITPVFDRFNQDIFGFSPIGFNAKGCSKDGLRADGSVCNIDDITKMYDPETNLDQFGLTRDGFNEKNCNLKGFNRQVERCALEDTPRIFGEDGIDQFGFRENGRNIYNCDEFGKKPNGDICSLDEITRIFDPKTGKDQLGFFENGRNEFDCNVDGFKTDGSICSNEEMTRVINKKTGKDILGFFADGYNDKNCDVNGRDRSGNICNIDDITRVIDKNTGLDQFGISLDGFNERNCNAKGLNRNGEICDYADIPKIIDADGYDQFGLGPKGRNRAGCDINGLREDGTLCSYKDIPKIFDTNGVNQLGLLKGGYSTVNGCGLDGLKSDGTRCSYEETPKLLDANGRNQMGFGVNGRNAAGCDINGLKEDGSRCVQNEMSTFYDKSGFSPFHKDNQGFDRLDFNELGFNEFNCDVNGLKPDGSICPIDEITRIFDKETGLDQFGLTKGGFNAKGCGLDGKDKNGNQCAIEEIPRIFDKNMNDQFGQNIVDLPDSAWVESLKKTKGASALVDASGEKMFLNGREVFADTDGVLRDAQGRLLLDASGKTMRIDDDGNIVNSDGDVVPNSLFTNKSGLPPKGQLGRIEDSMDKLVDSTGASLQIDGEDVYVDENGFLRGRDGDLILDENGSALSLDINGNIVDKNGNKVNIEGIKRPDGSVPIGKLNQRVSGANAELGALLNDDGEKLFINGKEVFVDAQGNLRNEDGTLLLGPNGLSMKLNSDGTITDSNGGLVDSAAFTDSKGRQASGLLSKGEIQGSPSFGADVSSPLENSDGQLLFVNGKEVVVDSEGNLRYLDGAPVLSDDGVPLRLSDEGVIVDQNGKVIPSSFFEDANGNSASGLFSKGSPVTKSELQARKLADKLTSSQKRALGISEDGFNESGCGLNGLNRQGEICDLADIPRLFDPETNLDQFGLAADGYNEFGCDLRGLNRQGEACDERFITHIFGADGYDQRGINALGLTRAGFNDQNKNSDGCDAMGNGIGCVDRTTSKLTDEAGVDQFNVGNAGKNRLGLTNGFNDAGCSIEGLDKMGNICAIEDIPLFLSDNGVDQFGISNETGLNQLGCGLDGLDASGNICDLNNMPRIFGIDNFDQFGLNPAGRNASGCDLLGFMPNGERCSSENITRIYDISGKDQFGIGKDGYNDKGCAINGVSRDGSACSLEDTPRIYDPATGTDQFGFRSDGYNIKGCDINGINKDGELCDIKDVTRVINPLTNRDQFDFGDDGYNSKNCDFYGYNREGELCEVDDITRIFDKKGNDQFNTNKVTGLNENGCSLNGLDKFGRICKPSLVVKFKNEDGVDRFGFKDGFNAEGCDINGLNAMGERCAFEDVTRIIDESSGLDQFDLTASGVSVNGCDINGLMKDGSVCKPKNIVSWFDSTGKDQFGLLPSGRNENGCDLLGLRADGTKCSREETSQIYGNDGFSQTGFNIAGLDRKDKDENGFFSDGCNELGKREDGTNCDKYLDVDLDVRDGIYIAAQKDRALAWISAMEPPQSIAIGDGTYNEESEQARVASALNAGGQLANTQSTIQGQPFGQQIAAQENATEVSKSGGANGIIEVPVGYMTQVFVKTPINSDYDPDVYADITYGEFAGATLVGKAVTPYVEDVTMPRDKFYYHFTKLIWNREIITVDVVSINTSNNSGMVEADDVDYHRFQRYGGLLFAAAVSGMGATYLDSAAEQEAAQQQDLLNQAQASGLLYGENTRELAKQNLTVATDFVSSIALEQFNRKPTITEGRGSQLVIFREQLEDDRVPVVFVGLE